MNNHTILNQRWNEIDSRLDKFMAKNNHTINDLIDNLDDLLKGIDFSYLDLFKYANLDDVGRLKREIKDLKENYKLEKYETYLLSQYDKIKMKYSDWLKGMILVIYMKQYQEQKTIESKFFDEISNLMYTQGQEETISELPKKKRKKARLLTIPEAFTLQLLATDCFNGYKWYDYKQGLVKRNADNFYTKVNEAMQTGKELSMKNEALISLVKKQSNAYLNKKKDTQDKSQKVIPTDKEQYDFYKDQYSGSLDNMISLISNQAYLAGMKAQGCKKCIFIAVLDNHTTEMCKSLDGQVFNIDDWNKFSRYSKEDDKNIIYTVYGMVIGANLPPINNGYHYCRSTIYPMI